MTGYQSLEALTKRELEAVFFTIAIGVLLLGAAFGLTLAWVAA